MSGSKLRGSELGNRYSPTGREILTGVTRTMIDVANPQPEQIFMVDIALSLSELKRFTGHCPLKPTVARHSLAVEHIAVELARRAMHRAADFDYDALSRAALMHDAPEYLVTDLNGAVKKELRRDEIGGVSSYDALEALAASAIERRFNCSPAGFEEIIHEADCLACAYEMAYLGWCPDAHPPAWVKNSPALRLLYSHTRGGRDAFLHHAVDLGMGDSYSAPVTRVEYHSGHGTPVPS